MTTPRNSRRSFLKMASGIVAAAPFISRIPRATAQAKKFDPSFGTATQAVAALRAGVISSRELTGHVFKRIQMEEAVKSGAKDPWLLGAVASHRDWAARNERRLRARAVWQAFFKDYDAFLLPVNFTPAFPHNHSNPDILSRKLQTTEGERAYRDQLNWICFATLTGCPASVAPVGRTKAGLPVGIQIMGPYLEDATPIDLAIKLSGMFGGFTPPPSFAE
jgi:Asp-tRNA(Asn)/Glu-tRNA(Gln) amidotransferase A subunit family amidase